MNNSAHNASEAMSQVLSNPKAQGTIGTILAGLGGYNIVETAQSLLGIISLIVGILVGIYALINAHKASKKADAEQRLVEIELKIREGVLVQQQLNRRKDDRYEHSGDGNDKA